MSAQEIAAVVGLGNPGAEYEGSRHNAGFEVLRLLGARLRIPLRLSLCRCVAGVGNVAGRGLVLALPQTYMNRSGEAVCCLLKTLRLSPGQLLIVSDDIDLPPGVIRVRAKGGPGTHNGLRSIVDEAGSRDFPRVRVGIGPPPPGADLAQWVLTRDEAGGPAPAQALQTAADAVLWALTRGIGAAMNRFNAKVHDERPV